MTTHLPAAEPFDLCGPLPGTGVTVLEASAGTGKTYSIVALVVRMVAAGVPIESILAVTFTRMATAELRDRVRSGLVSAEAQLGRLVDAGEAPSGRDRYVALLAEGSRDEVGRRRERLKDALAVFDSATITTTHGFCQLMLEGLGVAGRVGTGATLIEDPSATRDEVLDDLYVRKVIGWGVPEFGHRIARQIAKASVENPGTRLLPESDPSTELPTVPERQRKLADAARGVVARRLLEANVLTYDDLIVRLRSSLTDPERGAAARERLARRYSVVLVDEFQDTDPVQWDVVRSAFSGGNTTLVLIGDPKQAIYSFRGGDVWAYLDAVSVADRRFTLTENWRSDAGLVAAYEALFDPLHVGHPEIRYVPVQAAPGQPQQGIRGAPVSAPLRARVLHSKDRLLRLTMKGGIQKDVAREWIAQDTATDIAGLLASGAEILGSSASAGGWSPVTPGDIAVLVRTNLQALDVQTALRKASVPAVIGGTDSVFVSRAALDWLRLLEALEQPANRSRAVAVALSSFVGMTAEQVAGADEASWEDLHYRLHQWADILFRRGVAILYRTVASQEAIASRVLREVGGERTVTDLDHTMQLLHAEATANQLGPPALRAWLAERIDDGQGELADQEARSRRLDSDSDSVQVLTVHRAKGLEFPIVYCPFLWDATYLGGSSAPVVFHDPDANNERTLDVGVDGEPPAYRAHRQLAHEEERGEELRLLYVALTRARHQAVIWWAAATDAQHSPLGRLLALRQTDGSVPSSAHRKFGDAEIVRALERVREVAGEGLVSIERCESRTAPPQPERSDEAHALEAASFDRALDLAWRRTSYTAITEVSHGEIVGSEPEHAGTIDEPIGASVEPVRARDSALDQRHETPLSPWTDLPAGAEFGTFVHGVLESVDFTASDLRSEVLAAIDAEGIRRPAAVGDVDVLADAIVGAISTPLGPMLDDACLRDIHRADRLDELGFELPLAGGDRPVGAVTMRGVARIFEETCGEWPALSGYAERLRAPSVATEVRGYLSGSLDLVMRVHDADGTPRFYVADYKTNWLGPSASPLLLSHYGPAAISAEMLHAHYPLQAMLYTVALHRYLRWKLAGYSPDKHLGGVLYLFLRGMSGPANPVFDGQPCGVFSWPTPPLLAVGLSDLLESGLLESGRS